MARLVVLGGGESGVGTAILGKLKVLMCLCPTEDLLKRNIKTFLQHMT